MAGVGYTLGLPIFFLAEALFATGAHMEVFVWATTPVYLALIYFGVQHVVRRWA
jgi:hypothetical protein